MNRVRKLLIGVLLIIVFVLVLIGSADNSGSVALVFLDYATPKWPIAWWILIAFSLGTFFGYLMTLSGNVRSRVAVLKTKKELAKTTAELEKIQEIPERLTNQA